MATVPPKKTKKYLKICLKCTYLSKFVTLQMFLPLGFFKLDQTHDQFEYHWN